MKSLDSSPHHADQECCRRETDHVIVPVIENKAGTAIRLGPAVECK